MNKEVNLLVDVSGNCITSEVEKAIQIAFEVADTINLIQFDTEVKAYEKINKKARTVTDIISGGGTIIQSGLDYISKNGELKEYDTFIFTDGYTERGFFNDYEKNITHIKPCIEDADLDILISPKSNFNTIIL